MLTSFNERELRSRINRIGWTLTIMVGMFQTVSSELFYLYGGSVSVAVGAVMDTLCYLSYFFVPALLFYAMSKNKPAEPIKFKIRFTKHLPLMILAGLAVTQGAGIINTWFDGAIGYALPSEDYTAYLSDPELIALFMTVSLAPAFAEELLFRGVIYSNLRPYGKTFAILVSSVAFGLMHQNVSQLFYTTVAGIVMALIYEATGSIWGSVFLHMINNLYAVLQTAILYRYDETTATVILTLAQTVIVLLGTISLICLVCIARRDERRRIQETPPSLFGAECGEHTMATQEQKERSITPSLAFKALFTTPGMLAYLISSVVTTLLLVFMYTGTGGA